MCPIPLRHHTAKVEARQVAGLLEHPLNIQGLSWYSLVRGEPRPSVCKTQAGYENLCRVRVGGWRISYVVEDDRLIVLVIKMAFRGGGVQSFGAL